jgi:hypothetical protein
MENLILTIFHQIIKRFLSLVDKLGIVSRLQAGPPGVLNPARDKYIFLLYTVQIGPGTHPATHFMDPGNHSRG